MLSERMVISNEYRIRLNFLSIPVHSKIISAVVAKRPARRKRSWLDIPTQNLMDPILLVSYDPDRGCYHQRHHYPIHQTTLISTNRIKENGGVG